MAHARRARRFGACYAVVGCLLCVAPVVMKYGIYRGMLQRRLSVFCPETETVASVDLDADSRPVWCWRYPDNHVYQTVTMEVLTFGEQTDAERTVQVDLANDTWASDGDQGRLDADSLARLVMGADDAGALNPASLQPVESLLDTFHQMSTGTFLRPRHHPYSVDDSDWNSAVYTHFTGEIPVWLWMIGVWLLVWPAYLFLFKQPRAPGRMTPRKTFVTTAVTVVILDLAMVGVHIMFSPGDISEEMELLIAVLNLPAWLALGDYGVRSWLGMAFGAVSWSVLASLVVLLLSTSDRAPGVPYGASDDQPPWEFR